MDVYLKDGCIFKSDLLANTNLHKALPLKVFFRVFVIQHGKQVSFLWNVVFPLDPIHRRRSPSLARSSKNAKKAGRLLSLCLIYDCGIRSYAARHGGVVFQTVRDWMLRFNYRPTANLLKVLVQWVKI